MLESLPKLEKKKSSEKQILNALELSMEQEQELVKKIEQNNGVIRIFVHPYFPSKNMNFGNTGKWYLEDKERMQKMFEKMAEVEDENQAPLFVFEEQTEMAELTNRLKDNLGRNIYSIPTGEGTSRPEMKINWSQDDWEMYKSMSWTNLKIQFEKWGIKKITIGGQSLAFDYDGDRLGDNPYKLDGCVGSAILYLEDDFEIEVSNFSYPINRKQYKKYKDFKYEDDADIVKPEDLLWQ